MAQHLGYLLVCEASQNFQASQKDLGKGGSKRKSTLWTLIQHQHKMFGYSLQQNNYKILPSFSQLPKMAVTFLNVFSIGFIFFFSSNNYKSPIKLKHNMNGVEQQPQSI